MKALLLLVVLFVVVLCDGPAPPSRWCLFPDGYNVSNTNGWETVYCPGINSYTYFDWQEYEVLPSIHTPAFADIAPCGELAASSADALECLGAFGLVACNQGCPKLNDSYALGYEYPIFEAAVCNATKTTCASAFPDPGCLFNPNHTFFKNVLEQACEGGAQTNNRDPNPNEGFPYVQANTTFIALDVQETIDNMPRNSPEDNWCLFPFGYDVTPQNDYRTVLCPSANDPLYYNHTTRKTQTTPTTQAHAQVSGCLAHMEDAGALDCIAAMLGFMCQIACAESRGPTDYETPVFPASTCQDINSKCAIFTNASCPFSPSYQTYSFARATSCEGGGLSGGKTATTTYGFPYVQANATKAYEDVTAFGQTLPSPLPSSPSTPSAPPPDPVSPTGASPSTAAPSVDETNVAFAAVPTLVSLGAIVALNL